MTNAENTPDQSLNSLVSEVFTLRKCLAALERPIRLLFRAAFFLALAPFILPAALLLWLLGDDDGLPDGD